MFVLKVIRKNVYGNELIYPACERSKEYLRHLGLKTFTTSAISAAIALGAIFEHAAVTL